MFKNIYLTVIMLLSVSQLVHAQPQLPSTTYTRSLLRATNATQAKALLEISNSVVTTPFTDTLLASTNAAQANGILGVTNVATTAFSASLLNTTNAAQANGVLGVSNVATTTFSANLLNTTSSNQAFALLTGITNTYVYWADAGAFKIATATYTSGVLAGGAITWPDGSTGVLTTVVNTNYSAVDSYSIVTGTNYITQPTVTRDASGNVTTRPVLSVGSFGAEPLAWAAKVTANGGTYSSATLLALNTFSTAISSIRPQIKRFNPFAGDNLAAALTPLIADVGYPYDTNYNTTPFGGSGVLLVETNYVPTLGLMHPSTTVEKILATGVSVLDINPTNGLAAAEWMGDIHFAVGLRPNLMANDVTTGPIMGVRDDADNADVRVIGGVSGTTGVITSYFIRAGDANALAANLGAGYSTGRNCDFWFMSRYYRGPVANPIQLNIVVDNQRFNAYTAATTIQPRAEQLFIFAVTKYPTGSMASSASNVFTCYSMGNALTNYTTGINYEPTYRAAVSNLMINLGRN